MSSINRGSSHALTPGAFPAGAGRDHSRIAGQSAVDRYLQAKDCEELTGIPAGTWRYWAHIGSGPMNFKLGRRRVWRLSSIEAWIAEQESKTQNHGGAA